MTDLIVRGIKVEQAAELMADLRRRPALGMATFEIAARPAHDTGLREALASVEFVHGICPACSGTEPYHDDDCRIAAALADSTLEPTDG